MRWFTPIFLLTFTLAGAASEAQVMRPFHGRFVADNEPMEKRPWVGVSVAPAPASLRHQLKVTDGVGLVVEFVQPKSPAADAGLKPFDLLLKLDDQWLINPDQFAVLIRMHHAGDEVKLTCLSEGNERTVSVKLVEHEAARLPEWDGNFAWPNPPQPPHVRPPRPAAGGPFGQSSVFRMLDGQRELTVTATNGHRSLHVKENGSGKVLFDGPIDTDEQRATLSPEVRRSLDDMTRLASEFEARHGLGEGDRPAPSTQPADPRPRQDGGAEDHAPSR
ncbi:MAG TPA: PDZ domain-containing protein [Tepidisphaeraceae bacterium]|jgi:hypothetical protein